VIADARRHARRLPVRAPPPRLGLSMKLPFIRRRKRATRVVVMERRQWLLGGLATVLVAAVWWAGGLQFIERLTFDWRTRWFWRFSEPPSANIAIVAMDDASITSVGRWPWPRSYLAAIIDELRFAEVQVAALDLLLDDPEKPLLVERPDPANWEFSDTPRDPSSPPPRNIVSVDGDRLFADAILALPTPSSRTATSFLPPPSSSANAPPRRPPPTPSHASSSSNSRSNACSPSSRATPR